MECVCVLEWHLQFHCTCRRKGKRKEVLIKSEEDIIYIPPPSFFSAETALLFSFLSLALLIFCIPVASQLPICFPVVFFSLLAKKKTWESKKWRKKRKGIPASSWQDLFFHVRFFFLLLFLPPSSKNYYFWGPFQTLLLLPPPLSLPRTTTIIGHFFYHFLPHQKMQDFFFGGGGGKTNKKITYY